MTVARPLAAFFSACFAGILENIFDNEDPKENKQGDKSSLTGSSCCSGAKDSLDNPSSDKSFFNKIKAGLKYAITDVWSDLAGWFLIGLLIAGAITVFVPKELLSSHLGGGLSSMLVMLAAGIPIYICATASTPVAAALIMKGASPGSALVFLMAGPATNITALSVIMGILGKRGTILYLVSIAFCAVVCGLLLDGFYAHLGISAAAKAGEAAKMLPLWLRTLCAILLLILSVYSFMKKIISSDQKKTAQEEAKKSPAVSCSCGCQANNEKTAPQKQKPVITVELSDFKVKDQKD